MKRYNDSLHDFKKRGLSDPERFDESLSGAHVYARPKISPGYNLFDGRLVDMDGRIVNKWGARFLGVILPDGRCIAQREYRSKIWGLYTWDDQTVWEKDILIHHDVFFTPQGTFFTLQKESFAFKGMTIDFDMVFDIIVEYDLKGRELKRWRSSKNLFWFKKLFGRPVGFELFKKFLLSRLENNSDTKQAGERRNYTYFSINSFQLLPDNTLGRRDSRFRQGNWLISCFYYESMVVIIDQDTHRPVWSFIGAELPGELQYQHGPNMLSNGNILLFDNGRWRGWSRVVEIDPETKKIVWEYRPDDFFSRTQGYAQRFANGNTMITDAERGRALELTSQGELVWEYFHPDRQDESNSRFPESYGKRQRIYRMIRYAPEFIEPLIRKAGIK